MNDPYYAVLQALSDADNEWVKDRKELEATKQALADVLGEMERLKKPLQHIASQWLPESMGSNIRKNADWEGAYEMMVKLARETLDQ